MNTFATPALREIKTQLCAVTRDLAIVFDKDESAGEDKETVGQALGLKRRCIALLR